MVTFTCPACGKTIGAEVPPGSAVTCPLCQQVVTVPGEAPAEVPMPPVPPTQATWPMTPNRPVRQGMAVTSMVLGILSVVTGCFPIFGLISLILGIVALVRASRRPAEFGGKGYAIAGVCLSAVSILVMVFVTAMLVAIMLPSLGKARELAKRSVCQANLAGTGKALMIYANQYRGQYPPDLDMLVAGNLAQPGQFLCPSSSASEKYDSTSNSYIGGLPISPKVREAIHSCYVYIPGQNQNSPLENVLMYEKKECHHGEGANVLFGDGHAQWVEPYSEVERRVAQTKARLGISGGGGNAAGPTGE